jgi:AraC-like DNA-binding protein
MAEEYDPLMEYEEKGYLNCDFRLFHLNETRELDTPWHYHDFDKIVFFLGGNARYCVEGRSYDLISYDCVIVPHHSIHKVTASKYVNYERYVLYLRPETMATLEKVLVFSACGGGNESNTNMSHTLDACFRMTQDKRTNLVHFDAASTADLIRKFQKLEKDLDTQNEMYAAAIQIQTDLTALLTFFNESCVRQKGAFQDKARYNRKVVDIIDYINSNLGGNLSIDCISDEFFISKYHMMRLFKAETGYSMHQYIMEKRILRARDLIVGGEPAMAAALDSGFHDYSTFCKAFQKQTGKLPSEYLA